LLASDVTAFGLTAWADRATREQLSAQGCTMDVVEDAKSADK
jgi:hypothetical protein